MLPKENRLKKNKDFKKVFKEGKGFKEDFLVLKKAKNNLKISRFGFVVSKTFFKKATLRNKIKRRLRESVRIKLNEIKKGVDGCYPRTGPPASREGLASRPTIRPGMDVVLIVLPGVETKDFWEIEETIDRLFKKAKII